MADMGTDNYEQEFTLGLVEKDRNLLREINAALAKIQNGTFGSARHTASRSASPAWKAQPWAKYSIEYARSSSAAWHGDGTLVPFWFWIADFGLRQSPQRLAARYLGWL
jgi:RNA polymerase-binding transcription factor DksA